MTEIMHTVLAYAEPLLVTMLIGLVAQWMKKNGIDMTVQQRDYFTKVVTDGIHLVEEKAANGSGVSTGAAKHAAAVAYVQEKIPGTSTKDASDAIHAALPETGHGATAPVLVAVDPVSGRSVLP